MTAPRRVSALLLALLTALGALVAPATAETRPPGTVRPLERAHAHNDYEHERPLLDALDHGFTSVEADIHLVGDQLLVGHDPEDLTPERTLEALYLEPLRQRVLAHHGRVYRRPAEFQLLVDVKTEAVSTYAALRQRLRHPRYAFLFTAYVHGLVRERAVTVVLSGNRPREVLAAERYRLAFYDGRIVDPTDLGPGADARLVPLVSDNWTRLFSWTGEGPFPPAERERLREIVRTAHAAGQRVRFWATPDTPGPARTALWRELVAAEVDHVNTDDLAGLAAFLRAGSHARKVAHRWSSRAFTT
ncbi:Glycerophosphoryl diester phosphodiesterase family protein [Amycolatopsis arida]|uniref:Altered inheritance of mitochondria protein 6 n=1 Tax=Amycolatopsis arida TaxID=587909 RepID=A0A1I5QNF9_9PSEU|nr:phosphatidylinositol-specific phospholipase C/glycerophosphodiester phosphodiesterase family protein [Amycolatopsis arida]TDX98907.1 glycerophosphoryl diester phosphodiesterase family protein [Amycolatopsis arida]SFP47804.1 Glycerophosphoryl diester phosphodiesterase family protein [Amycolatopsis arida]